MAVRWMAVDGGGSRRGHTVLCVTGGRCCRGTGPSITARGWGNGGGIAIGWIAVGGDRWGGGRAGSGITAVWCGGRGRGRLRCSRHLRQR